MSRADLMKYTNQGGNIPEVDIPFDGLEYYHSFWDIRDMIGDPDKPVNMSAIREWQDHTYRKLDKFERDFIFKMDRAFRHSRIEVLKYHEKRPKLKLEDNDRQRMGNKRR